MVRVGETRCPICGKEIKRYDKVHRIIKGEYGKRRWIDIQRLLCSGCGALHSELPFELLPYKHYEAQIIEGFIFERYSSCDLEFEDYPSETTIKRWKSLPLTSVSQFNISNLE